ncbi:MAG: ABC transporter ATP-binding protein [Polyangiaceae bacterium]|nr:ABC transporter ATP-binding protein [Polyangiaceae bacterium]MCE7892675.1 ABC transporter ATP-binding protein [Sorangiineae bacterium PRO1]MCL4755303.1 ABC transporter ATP-binding protein [Myxococcales bacterium]
MSDTLLQVEHLTTAFHTDRGTLRAVDDVSFSVKKGKTLAVVGESGCGKSVTALSIMRLVPSPPGSIERGKIDFLGKDLVGLPEKEMRSVRGDKISMIFQEPMTSLNPVYSVGAQIVEAIRIHRKVSRRAARDRALEMLKLVGIPSPAERIDAYPHQLSGGMRQRVMIAMALACDPALLIADEPTTALDVTIQAQILDLLRRLQEDLGMSILFITHDLGVVAEFASDVVVMYAGRVVETGSVEQIFADPLHPYTRGLLASVPPMDSSQDAGKPRRLPTIDGVVPDLAKLPAGCRFADRCALYASGPDGAERCTNEEPELSRVAEDRSVRCHFAKGAN